MIRRPLAACAWTLAVTVLACRSAGEAASRTLIRHDFTDSAQGWIVRGDTRPTDAIFSPTGGHPGGCITGVDEALGETWYFLAPPEVLRQLPQAVNGTLSYGLKQSATLISLFDEDIVIVGPAGRLSYRFPVAPGTDWQDFSVRLSASAGWTWNWNRRATQTQIEKVLAAPTLLQIRGEYATGDDTASLDNFELRTGSP
jgi:Laminin B (Domain IV)